MTRAYRRDRTEAVYAFIAAHIGEHGYAPSLREVAAGVGLTSTASVNFHLGKLQADGRIAHTPGKPRTLRLVTRSQA